MAIKIKNIYLSLMIGPVIAVPVPQQVIEALDSIEVKSSSDRPSGFQLIFNFSSDSILTTILLLLGEVGPFVRVILVVIVSGIPHVIMDGVITKHDVSPNVETGQSTLTVTGEDLSVVMNHIDFTGIPYPGMPAEARVALILAKYAVYGMIPLIIPSVMIDVPIPVEKIPTHQGKDLMYIKSLADKVGHVFYVEPGPVPGANIAYWGPQIKIGIPQPALNVNMDAHTNVQSLSFSFDGCKRTMPVVFIQEENSKAAIPIPIPGITPLNPPLGALLPGPVNFEQLHDTAKMKPAQAIMVGLAKAAQSADVVTGTGSLDVLRYGRVLKSRGLVGVRGAGLAFDGLYYVKSVTHKIKRGEYKQDFTLTRNGLLPTVPIVPV